MQPPKIREFNPLTSEQIIWELIKIQEQDHHCNLRQFRSLVSAHQYTLLYQTLRKYIPTGKTVLDWGCGNGHFSYFLLKSGYQTVGFSFDDFYFRRYFDSQNYEFELGNYAHPQLISATTGKFDAVVSVGVLEHVRETSGSEIDSLQEISRILKPGGYFICYHFPNQFSLIEAIASQIPGKHHHRYRYTQAQIKTLCQQTQFALLEIQRYGLLPRNFWELGPKFGRNSRLIAALWNYSDNLLKYPFSLLCQNYMFVAQKVASQI